MAKQAKVIKDFSGGLANGIDETNLKENTSSMARTTGYTASATIDILDQNMFIEKGVFPPEIIGSKSKVVDYLVTHLRKRDIILKKII